MNKATSAPASSVLADDLAAGGVVVKVALVKQGQPARHASVQAFAFAFQDARAFRVNRTNLKRMVAFVRVPSGTDPVVNVLLHQAVAHLVGQERAVREQGDRAAIGQPEPREDLHDEAFATAGRQGDDGSMEAGGERRQSLLNRPALVDARFHLGTHLAGRLGHALKPFFKTTLPVR